jgi:hypothetical protein
MEIVEKGWNVTVGGLAEPYLYEDVFVHAENKGQARSKGFDEMKYQNAEVQMSNTGFTKCREVQFTDIRVTRSKEHDLIKCNDEVMTRQAVGEKRWCEQRDEEAKKIMDENPYGIAVVYAGCYSFYWGPNHAGYYSNLLSAGKYSTKEAYDIVKGSDYSRRETVMLVKPDEYNKDIDSQIEALKTKIQGLEHSKIDKSIIPLI